jgi:2'-5' RNA ligase
MSTALDTAILITGESLAWFTDRWRSRSVLPLDPPMLLSEAIPPHITLLSPWHPQPDSEDAADRLRRAVSAVEPFTLRLDSVAAFPAGTVYLQPRPSSGLHTLFEALTAAFPEFPPYGGAYDDWRPHLTVSRRGGAIVADEVRAGSASSRNLTLVVEEVSAWECSPSGRWVKRLGAPLAGRGSC